MFKAILYDLEKYHDNQKAQANSLIKSIIEFDFIGFLHLYFDFAEVLSLVCSFNLKIWIIQCNMNMFKMLFRS